MADWAGIPPLQRGLLSGGGGRQRFRDWGPFVIYRKLYGDGGLWLRSLEMFLSKVDQEKYPDCPQEYRFELQEIPSKAGH
ncbi:DUF1653 domain-containing protein [Faecalibacterium sp. OF04-11AC]|uniref:DUF1653 domain-containing protein n=1 Tax=Faecalibacterium sp. OF04-11AC TaxID=2293109 RepID=UPI00325B0565